VLITRESAGCGIESLQACRAAKPQITVRIFGDIVIMLAKALHIPFVHLKASSHWIKANKSVPGRKPHHILVIDVYAEDGVVAQSQRVRSVPSKNLEARSTRIETIQALAE
jgi:hypothetical protein